MAGKAVTKLVEYGIRTGLVNEEDRIYVTNRILEVLQEDSYEEEEVLEETDSLEEILGELLELAGEKGLIDAGSITARDLFDTKLMGCLVEPPSVVTEKFYRLYQESPKKATDYFYKLSQDSDYIRRYRIKKDVRWQVDSPYGKIDISINLSKPEKDPKDIAAAKKMAQSGYPKCLLCKENVGYAGRMNHPARQNHRVIPLTIQELSLIHI